MRKENDRSSLDANLQNAIRDWNKLDSALFDHFLTKLEEKITLFGKERMDKELAEFTAKVKAWDEKCIQRYSQFDDKPWIARIQLKSKSGPACEKVKKNHL